MEKARGTIKFQVRTRKCQVWLLMLSDVTPVLSLDFNVCMLSNSINM